MRLTSLAAPALALALLAGCSSTTALPGAAVTTPPIVDAEQLLARHSLQGLTADQVVERLDSTEDDRAAGPVGSVRPRELLLSDSAGQARLALPADRFYLSIAPYLTTTHDCFNHNLATCKGELAGKTVHVSVVDAAGATVLERDVTTYPNGFAGLWLPRDIKATLTVRYDALTATTTIGTGDSDATCLTTLRLQ